MKAFLVPAAVLAVLIGGCTASDEPSSAPSTVEAPPVAEQDNGLQAKLLTEGDLPAGYTETALPAVKGGLGAVVGCPALDVRPSSDTGEASVSFAGATAGSLISESVRLSSAADSKAILVTLAAIPQQCSNAKAASISRLGIESTALRLTANPAELGIAVDSYVVGVRDDKMVIVVVFVSPGTADPAAVEAIAKTAWEKASPQ